MMVMYTTELVVKNANPSSAPDSWTMDDYLNGDLELVQVNRGAGANDVGMVFSVMIIVMIMLIIMVMIVVTIMVTIMVMVLVIMIKLIVMACVTTMVTL